MKKITFFAICLLIINHLSADNIQTLVTEIDACITDNNETWDNIKNSKANAAFYDCIGHLTVDGVQGLGKLILPGDYTCTSILKGQTESQLASDVCNSLESALNSYFTSNPNKTFADFAAEFRK